MNFFERSAFLRGAFLIDRARASCYNDNGYHFREGEPMTEKGKYHTRHQAEILQYLQSTRGMHHTAAQIKDHFAGEQKNIGTATIYRQLERMVEEGSVRRYLLETGDSACYEYVGESPACSNHFHCKCEQCGRLIHLHCNELEAIGAHLNEHHGFRLNPMRTVFYGLCESCAATA